MLKRLEKITFITLFFLATFLVAVNNVYAQDSCDLGDVDLGSCTIAVNPDGNAEKCIFEGERVNHPLLDIRRTIKNSMVAAIMDGTVSLITGTSLNQTIDCVVQNYQPICENTIDWENIGGCGFSLIPDGGTTRANGSLAGITYKVGSAVSQDQPIPTSLAHYFRYQVRKVPVLGDRVYAQSVDYNMLGADFILQLWQVFRNVAYGILAIVMIIIGVMIMVRKKINPQVVVTIQNALPRVVLGVILITFSYPIGATGAALIWPFRQVVDEIMNDLGTPFLVSEAGLGAIIMLILTAVMVGGPLGLLGLGLAAVQITLFILGLWITITLIALIKAITIYIKILMMIIFAPIQFALGTLPGNEKMIKDWFKLLAARVLSVPAIYFMISMAGFIINQALNSEFDPSGTASGTEILTWLEASGTTAIIFLFIPFVSIYLLVTAIKMPKKIEQMFMGPKRR